MKILIINDNGIEIGGAETYIKYLKESLIDKGHDVRVLASIAPIGVTAFSDYTFKGVNKKSIFRIIPYIFNIHAYRKLKKVLKEFKPDIVHLHFIFYHTSPSVLLALGNIPTVMTMHAHEVLAPVGINITKKCRHPFIGYCIKCTGNLKYYPEKFKRFIFKKLSNNINFYISPSKYYEKLYMKAGFQPIIYIYNGILPKNEYKQISVSNRNLLFVGRLVPEKGVDYIIKALPLILKEFSDTTLTIVGDGQDFLKIKQMIIELSLKPNVKLIGRISNKDTNKFYEDTTIVIVPSIYPDNLPTVCIEAMNNGRAIIASSIGGLPEMVTDGENGFLIEPRNYQEIAKKVCLVFSDKELLVKISKNSRKMIDKFSINKNIENLLSLYTKL